MEEETIEKYIEWVTSKIEQIKKYTKSLNKRDVNIQDIKEVLSNRVNVSLMLNAEYQRYKRQLSNLKREYTVWWSEVYSEIRKELNPVSLPGSKWVGKGDIEAQAITNFKDIYLKYNKEIDLLDDQISFLRRLLEDWNSVSYDCGNIVKLLEIEAYMYKDVIGKSEDATKRRQR